MASVATQPPSASKPYTITATTGELPAGSGLILYLLLSACLCACTIWLLQHNYMNEYALNHWGKVLGVLDSSEKRLEYFGLVYPHLPFYLLFPFHYIPYLNDPAAPYLLSCMIAAGVLVFWHRQLYLQGFAAAPRLLFLALMVMHPYFLWAATTGTQMAITLALFYALGVTILRMATVQDTRSFMMLGVIILFFFFADERVLYLMAALIPLLPLVLPQLMLADAALSAYLVTFTPWALAFLAWAYINWLYLGDPWQFMTSPDSAFRAPWNSTPYVPWLRDYGGRLFYSLGWSLFYGLPAFPVMGYLLWRLRGQVERLNTAIVLFALPFISTAIATADFYLPHPIHMLFLLSAATMVVCAFAGPSLPRTPYALGLWLFLSVAGGWLSFTWAPSPEMAEWTGAARGQAQAVPYQAEGRLGAWLDTHRQETLMDDHSAQAAIVARGDAMGLILPFSREFKLYMLRSVLTAPQVVVPNPKFAPNDLLARRYPDLYRNGAAGYRLVYDQEEWRVYRRR